jgi:hypothetical protein
VRRGFLSANLDKFQRLKEITCYLCIIHAA